MADPVVSTPRAAPVTTRERFETLDVLRGVALLGILVVNILMFAYPFAIVVDPPVVIDYSGANRVFLWITSIGFLTKMMSLFSLLFGAGVIMYDRKGKTGKLTENTALWYRRMAWLLGIGAFHALVIWYGDILVWYALCGLALLWWVRRLPPLALFGLAILFFLIFVGLSVGMSKFMLMSPAAQEAIDAGKNPMFASFPPSEEIEAYRGSWLDGFLGHRLFTVLIMWFLVVPFQYFWLLSGIMLTGMALTKTGVLTGERSVPFYAWLGGALLVVTLPISWWAWSSFEASGFAYDQQATIPLSVVGPVQAVGYACLIIAATKIGLLGPARGALASVGRMALTTYLMTSVLATFVFYGWGLGRFAHVEYPALAFVVMGIWTVMIAFASVWLRFFRFGPVEWAWRSLTYWKLQPIRLDR